MSLLNQVPDSKWIRQSFILPANTVSALDRVRMVSSATKTKFTDTTIGGSWAINAPPQFTSYSDPPIPGLFSKSRGLGRAYDELVESPGQYVHMQFGVPEFNSLEQFFTGFYNGEAGLLARTGRSRSIFYDIGRVVGFVVTLPAMPLIAAGVMYKYLAGKPASKYYYMKQTMPLYWNAVNTMVNDISVNMGIVPRVLTPQEESMYPSGPSYGPEDIALYHKVAPDIFSAGGGIDVYAIATKAQRLANQNYDTLTKLIEDSVSRADLVEKMKQYQQVKLSDPGNKGITEYLSRYVERSAAKPPTDVSSKSSEDFIERARSWYNDMVEFSMGEARDGAAYVTFKVDNTGSVSESFSSSVRESDLASKINSMSSSGRSKRFTFMGGNIADGVIADTIESIMGAVSDLVVGTMDQLGVAGIATMAGSCFVDIPKHWDASTADLPTMQYNIQLRAPYGNPITRLRCLVLPLCMLLAGALPLATGKQSYTSPFLCSLFSKGRAQTRLGMITQMMITRGVGNTGWTDNDDFMGIDVSFTVTDFSSVVYMPINAAPTLGDAVKTAVAGVAGGMAGAAVGGTVGSIGGPIVAMAGAGTGGVVGAAVTAAAAAGIFDEDNSFNDYMAVLGGLSMADQVYTTKKLRLSLTRKLTAWDRWLSPTHAVSWAFGTPPGRILQGIAETTDRK